MMNLGLLLGFLLGLFIIAISGIIVVKLVEPRSSKDILKNEAPDVLSNPNDYVVVCSAGQELGHISYMKKTPYYVAMENKANEIMTQISMLKMKQDAMKNIEEGCKMCKDIETLQNQYHNVLNTLAQYKHDNTRRITYEL